MSEFTSTNLVELDPDDILTRLPSDLSVTLKNAEALLHTLPRQKAPSLNLRKVTRLGKNADKKPKDELPVIADILAAGHQSFCVGFRGSSKEDAAYFIGTESDADGKSTESLLRAGFGLAETAPLEDKAFRYECSGVCKRIIFNEDQLKQLPKASEASVNWVESLAYSSFNKDCEIRLSFSPLDTDWLNGELTQAVDFLDILSEYQESNLQISHNGGVSINKNGHVGTRLMEFFKASQKSSGNESDSASVTLKREHRCVSLAYEQLQFRIHELQQLKRDGGWSLCIHAKAHREADMKTICKVIGSLFIRLGYQCVWEETDNGSGMMLTGPQIAEIVRHPENSFPGIEIEQLHNFEANVPKKEGKPSLRAGHLIWNGQEMKDITATEESMIEIPLEDLNSHAFICGKSGSGKTNSVCSLLSRLYGIEIPFMAIEPVKGEYRCLKSIMPDLQIFNLEIHGENQLRMNPFWFPKHGKLSYHIDSLKSIITSSFNLEAAMPDILEQCLVSSYVKKGWNISTNQNVFAGKLPDEMLYPTFTTLCHEVEQYLEDAVFGAELKSNYKGALLSRLQSYTTGTKGLLLNCPVRPNFEEWIRDKTSCVIELDELADDSDKSIVMGTLLTQYFQCVKYGRPHNKPELKHVIVLEEAHHLFKETASVSGGNNNRQHLVEMLSNMLAEIRAYGEGIFIVDQSPTTISPQVIKNTAVKLVHHTDYVEDLKVLHECLLLDETDERAPASLKRGHALLRFSSMHRPVHVHMPLCEVKEETGIGREPNHSSDDAQNILDMIRMNRISREKLHKKCHMFVNHFLFDIPFNKITTLNLLIESLLSEAVSFGYDRETLAGLSEEGLEYILRNLITESLPSKYPNQYLLCGRLQMVIERYLELCMLQSDGITEHQSLLIEQYIIKVLRPDLAYYYKNSTSPELRRIAGIIPPSYNHMVCMSEIISGMIRTLKKAQLEERKKGRMYDIEAVFSQPAKLVVFAMCEQFFMQPLPHDLTKDLWLLFKTC